MSVSVFISYAVESVEHNRKVMSFANKLKMRGIDVTIFTEMKLGDRFPVFMEKIEDCDFTLIICTPEYRQKANKRSGGVGYEWNIVTTSVASNYDERKFIPVLFSGDWNNALPIWARGKLGVDYRNESQEEFEKLISAFEEYETLRNCEIIDLDGEIRHRNAEDKSFKDRLMITIINKDDVEEVVQVIAYFTLKSTGDDYLVFTKQEKDENGNVVVYTSRVIDREDGKVTLEDLSEQEWEEVKQVFLEIANEE